MKNAFLVGKKVYLRPLEQEDAPALAEWLNDREVSRGLLVHRPINQQAEQGYLDEVARSEHDIPLGIVVRDGDVLVGVVGLHALDPRHRHASLGIFIGDKTWWGKGLATEACELLLGYAFGTLNLNKVWLHVVEINERAIRVYEKLGFTLEGTLREDFYLEGRYWSTLVMSLLREDWERRASARK
jgi:RimJ/RimL family protein N-acetyltransferase